MKKNILSLLLLSILVIPFNIFPMAETKESESSDKNVTFGAVTEVDCMDCCVGQEASPGTAMDCEEPEVGPGLMFNVELVDGEVEGVSGEILRAMGSELISIMISGDFDGNSLPFSQIKLDVFKLLLDIVSRAYNYESKSLDASLIKTALSSLKEDQILELIKALSFLSIENDLWELSVDSYLDYAVSHEDLSCKVREVLSFPGVKEFFLKRVSERFDPFPFLFMSEFSIGDEEISGAYFSPNVEVVAVSHKDGSVEIRTTESGEVLNVLKPSAVETDEKDLVVDKVIWSPNGEKVAVIYKSGIENGIVIIWSFETGEVISKLESPGRTIDYFCWYPDGEMFLISRHHFTRESDVYNSRTGELHKKNGFDPSFVEFSSDGESVLTVENMGLFVKVCVRNIDTGEELYTVNPYDRKRVNSARWLPGEKRNILFSGSGAWRAGRPVPSIVRVIGPVGQVARFDIDINGGTVESVDFSLVNPRLALINVVSRTFINSPDLCTLHILDIESGKLLQMFGNSCGFSWSSDGNKILVASIGGMVRVFREKSSFKGLCRLKQILAE